MNDNPIFKMFSTQPAINYLASLSTSEMLINVTNLISKFKDYYESLSDAEKKYLLKNVDGYDKNNWQFAVREPDDESKLFRNGLKFVILNYLENGKRTELEMLYDFDPEFLNKTTQDFQLQMVRIATSDASFSKYNPEFMHLYIMRDKKAGIDKGITTKGFLFGDKEIVLEKTMPMLVINEEEKV